MGPYHPHDVLKHPRSVVLYNQWNSRKENYAGLSYEELWMQDWLKLYQTHLLWKSEHLRYEHFYGLQSTFFIHVPRNLLTLLRLSRATTDPLLLCLQCHHPCSLLWPSPLWSRATLPALWSQPASLWSPHHSLYTLCVETFFELIFCSSSHLHLSSFFSGLSYRTGSKSVFPFITPSSVSVIDLHI